MINVLIVEDDPMVAKLNKKYVQSIKGFNVVGETSSKDEVLNYCRNNRIDLIILDIYMPKIDGISILKELRKRFIMIDVIMVTASKEAENIYAALKLGAVDYLIKPFEYERLKKSLENYKSRYKLLRDTKTVKQEDLDEITKSFGTHKENELIKGLHEKTLDRIRLFMKNNPMDNFSSEDIANKIALSKVTIRRYLEYLESIGEVTLHVEYGTIGRPSHMYKYMGQ